MTLIVPGTFFRAIFGSTSGYVAIAVKKKEFKENYFRYPEQLKEMHEFVETTKYAGNMYFCPQLLTTPHRLKTNVSTATCVWADLDTCQPKVLLVKPTITLETSPNRFQAFWVFEANQAPSDAEAIARKIAYHHADQGADKSGWDLTQLLRIPGTRNFKYGEGIQAPEVLAIDSTDARYRLSDFDVYPDTPGYTSTTMPFPATIVVQDGAVLLDAVKSKVSGAAHELFHVPPKEGERSQRLFRLEMLCAEAGVSPQDTFQICRDAECNKWPDQPNLLWNDICRAFSTHRSNQEAGILPTPDGPELVSDAERRHIEANPSFIERYVIWAKSLGDAAPQYHQIAAFMGLSSIIAGSVRLPTSFGPIVPNLWALLLASTTLSRKSTSLNILMDLIEEIDSELLLATDGSIEGFATALAARPGKVSIFFRDEFTGLLESISKKDYLAGTAEFFTNLYDGKTQKRVLRKENLRIKDPRLVIFGGGIKARLQQLVTFEQVTSGFLPRFIFVTADTDPTKVKPLGPPTEQNWGARNDIKSEMSRIYDFYREQVPLVMDNKVVGTTDKIVDASMTSDAWGRFNQIDQSLMQVGMSSGDMRDILTPLYARLGFSMLKAAVLIAASRTQQSEILVEEEDIARAAYYGESWRAYAQDVIANIGKGPLEHKIELVANTVHKMGRASRSAIMQRYHLQSQEMSLIARTLDERGAITITAHGKTHIYQSTHTFGG